MIAPHPSSAGPIFLGFAVLIVAIQATIDRASWLGRFFGVAAWPPLPEDQEAKDAPRREAGASIPFWPTSMVDALDEPIRFVPTGRAEPREGAFVAELTVIGGAR